MERRGKGIAKASAVALYALVFVSIELWGDMKSCLPVLEPFHEYVEQVLLNGRFIALGGILVCGVIAAVAPRWFSRDHRGECAIAALFAALGTLSFFLVPMLDTGALGTAAAAVATAFTGFCYGWFIIKALVLLARSNLSLSGTMCSFAGGLAVKFVLLPLAAGLPSVGQGAAVLAMPIVAAGLLKRALCLSPRLTQGSGRLSSPLQPRLLLGMLALLPIMNAFVRTFSSLGAWGGAGLASIDDLPQACLTAVVLAGVAYAIFVRNGDGALLHDIVRALIIVIVGFLAVQSGLLVETGLPALLIAAFENFIETFSGALFWLSLVVAARSAAFPYSLMIGAGQALRNAVAIVLGVTLQMVPTAGRTIVLIVMSGLVLGLLLILDYLTGRQRPFGPGADETEEACAALSIQHELTPREREVLVMLGQGRSQAYIADKLYVAPSTIKTHVRHIYKKLGVSTKQELISLLRGDH